jgi:hypothetical protein
VCAWSRRTSFRLLKLLTCPTITRFVSRFWKLIRATERSAEHSPFVALFIMYIIKILENVLVLSVSKRKALLSLKKSFKANFSLDEKELHPGQCYYGFIQKVLLLVVYPEHALIIRVDSRVWLLCAPLLRTILRFCHADQHGGKVHKQD